MIEVEELCKEFPLSGKRRREFGAGAGRRIVAVDGVSFQCRPGRVFTLLGPNGAGKTTTLRLLAGLLTPTSGTVRVAGFDTRRQPAQVRGRIGFLTGSTGLYGRLTPLELLRYYADLHSLDAPGFRRRCDELSSRLGLGDFLTRRIARLSTGQKQKVSIARTLIHDPPVLVFDEPTAGLDVISARAIIELIQEARRAGKTIIFSTHIMGEVALLSDDLAVIHRGRLCFNGAFSDFTAARGVSGLEDSFIRLIAEAEA